MIWDRGTWTPEGDPHKGYKKGHLSFRLEGEKLHGGWHLVRMHGRQGETKEPWLLIKAQDDEARSGKAGGHPRREPRSVVSGRTIRGNRRRQGQGAGLALEPQRQGERAGRRHQGCSSRHRARARAAAASRARAKKRRAASAASRPGQDRRQERAPLPDFVPPSLATLRDARAQRSGLGARDQVRRLPHPGAARSRQGAAPHPQGARLDREVSRASRTRSPRCPADTR